jgi:Flp pilus assembly protein TadG
MGFKAARLRLKRFAEDRNGSVAILFALSSAAILLAVGIAVDYSLAVSTRDKMQAALDAAVIAGAEASSTQIAKNYFANDAPSISSAAAPNFTLNANGSVSGSETYSMPTLFPLFGPLAGVNSLSITVVATASPSTGSSTTSNSVCILLLSPSASQSLLANSGTNISGPNCEIDVSSTANPVAIFNSGVDINVEKVCLQGANYIKNGGTVTNLSAACSTASNPYVGKLPAPPSTTCTNSNGNYNGGTVNLTPGVYCGWFNFNSAPTVNFAPGVYVIQGGGWNVDGGTWKGSSGVTFYFADSSYIQYNSGMNLTLNAPTTGTYAGILFYEKDGLSNSNFVFDDSVSETMTGLIYLPSRNITFNSTSNETTPGITLIANTAIFNNLNWSLSPQTLWPISNSSTTSGGATTTTYHLTQ